MASPEAGRGNCLPYVQRLRRFPASQEDKYRDKIKIKKNKKIRLIFFIFNAFKTSSKTFIVLNILQFCLQNRNSRIVYELHGFTIKYVLPKMFVTETLTFEYAEIRGPDNKQPIFLDDILSQLYQLAAC